MFKFPLTFVFSKRISIVYRLMPMPTCMHIKNRRIFFIFFRATFSFTTEKFFIKVDCRKKIWRNTPEAQYKRRERSQSVHIGPKAFWICPGIRYTAA